MPEEELQEALGISRKYVEKWNQLEDDMFRQEHKTGYPRYAPEAIAQSKEDAVYLVARKHLSKK
jgi:hypothetical protein